MEIYLHSTYALIFSGHQFYLYFHFKQDGRANTRAPSHTSVTCYTLALADGAIPLPGSKKPSCFLETNLKEKVISDRNCYLMASFKKVEKRMPPSVALFLFFNFRLWNEGSVNVCRTGRTARGADLCCCCCWCVSNDSASQEGRTRDFRNFAFEFTLN
jgi:hypothetical protein